MNKENFKMNELLIRYAHACGIVNRTESGDPLLIVTGGFDDGGKTTEIFDFKKGTWEIGPDLPDARYCYI